MAEMLNAQRLREVLNYDPQTGMFRWRIFMGSRALAGAQAGKPDKRLGYVAIRVDRRLYPAHRLAWLYVHGNWPTNEIDHADGNPSNNQLANLRVATRSQQIANTKLRKNNSCGAKGVYWEKQRQKWRVRVMKNYRHTDIGFFSDLSEAAEAYERAARKIHGQFARRA